jgi:hypothetical protein
LGDNIVDTSTFNFTALVLIALVQRQHKKIGKRLYFAHQLSSPHVSLMLSLSGSDEHESGKVEGERTKKCRAIDAVGTVFFVAFLGAGSAMMLVPALRDAAVHFLHWVEHHQAAGAAAYVLVFAIGAVLCFPEVRRVPAPCCSRGTGYGVWRPSQCGQTPASSVCHFATRAAECGGWRL